MSKLNQNGAKMSIISTLLSSPKLFCYRIDMFRLCSKMTEKSKYHPPPSIFM